MNHFSAVFVVATSLLAFSCFAVQISPKAVARQQPKLPHIREERPPKSAGAPAPTECLRFARDFIAYIFRKAPNIGADKLGQQRWLSRNLQKGLAHRQELYRDYIKKYPDSPAEPPGNEVFVGAWDQPTAYSIIGSRRYADSAVI